MRWLHQVKHGNLRIYVQTITYLDKFNNSLKKTLIQLATYNERSVKQGFLHLRCHS